MKSIKHIIHGLNLYKIKIIKRISYLYSLSTKMIIEFFSFDARDSRHLSFIEAPIIVNVQASDLSNDFYYAMISQGGYLFKNYDALVKKY